MKAIAIIPARMGSSRFPGKPMAKIHGVPMIGHCYHRTKLCNDLMDTYVATCDDEINDYIISIGGETLSIPLSGRITAQSIYDYLGFNIEIDSSNVSVATREKIELDAFSKPFDASDVLSITLPPRQNQTMTVTISGNIVSPGTYVVLRHQQFV